MPDNKPKTNAINIKNMSKEERKALFDKFKSDREKYKATQGNNKTNKEHRNTVKTNKRNVKESAAAEFWKNNPDKKHSMKYGVNPNNPNKAFIEKTAYDGKGFGENDPISKAFSVGAGTLLTGGLANAATLRGLGNTAKVIKTVSKVKKGTELGG